MCASCGCGKPNDNHGDSRNITLNQLQGAAEAANISVGEVGDNLAEAALNSEDAPAEAANAESR
jgi:hypothetical protein